MLLRKTIGEGCAKLSESNGFLIAGKVIFNISLRSRSASSQEALATALVADETKLRHVARIFESGNQESRIRDFAGSSDPSSPGAGMPILAKRPAPKSAG